MSDRRTFLRGLATLPLIGGSVALIGKPTAAAVPVTDALLERYTSWLIKEHMALQKVRMLRAAATDTVRAYIEAGGIDQDAYGYRVRARRDRAHRQRRSRHPRRDRAQRGRVSPVRRGAVMIRAEGPRRTFLQTVALASFALSVNDTGAQAADAALIALKRELEVTQADIDRAMAGMAEDSSFEAEQVLDDALDRYHDVINPNFGFRAHKGPH